MNDVQFTALAITYVCCCLMIFVVSCFDLHECPNPYCPHKTEQRKEKRK